MKRLNIILAAVLVSILIFFIIFHSCGTLKYDVTGVAANASDHPEVYSGVCDILSNGTAPQYFTNEVPKDGNGLYLVATTIELKNSGFCNAEWIEVTAYPASGDIAVYSISGNGTDVEAGGSNTLTLKILTRTPEEARSGEITYYIMGVRRKIKIKY